MSAEPVPEAPPTLPVRPAHLHPMWRYGLALAWAAALVGLLVPENQGYDLGKQPFWWDGVLLFGLAVPDLAENAGIAVKQLIIAFGILLVSIGSLSGWDRRGNR